MKIKLFNEHIKLPVKSHLPDVGLDIFMPEDITVRPHETVTFGLGIGVQIPEGFAGILVPRSSICAKGLVIQDAIIDPDYTGEIHGIVTNSSDVTKTLTKDQRVMSLVVMSVLNPRIEVVEEFEKTERGDSGLGSTGK